MGPPAGQGATVALLELAVTALRQDDFVEAEELLTRVLRDDSEQADALHFLGVLRHRQGDTTQATELIRRALAREPRSAGMYVNLGNVLFESGQPHEALAAYRSALGIEAESSQIWSNLATVLHSLGELFDAHHAWQQATGFDPTNADAWCGLARTLIELGNVSEGLVANSRAIALMPRHLIAREEVIRALVLLDRRTEAERLYREWLDEDPGNPVAHHQLAALLEEEAPRRASDAYLEAVFDSYAPQFDRKLAALDYQAPRLIADAVARWRPAAGDLDIADLGCGTGQCGALLRPWASRLVGCDLSTGMLVRARQRQCYDALYKVDLEYFLANEPRRFDLLVSADTLCYMGPLDGVCAAAAAALRPGGRMLFTVEALTQDDATWKLQTTGRYSHTRRYLVDSLRATGFDLPAVEAVILRQEAGLPVHGWLVLAEQSRLQAP